MYAWIWRKLPGRPRTRALTAAVLAAAVVAVLWYAVFPLLEPVVTVDEVTVEK
ncbi:hypothetical protein SAMN05444920_104487 [Nonomuraea solani]|uniref:Uncharacterized protein n=1 Tax=Nonomuraea solani TaxID=1144553 RepID=A0A1H6CXE1_9ACTN|nr:hypothetical protein [Nonomuraea solani]SEG77403.1 hypothetical protein SAMN05444920_104487 [Nonomuraea solani]